MGGGGAGCLTSGRASAQRELQRRAQPEHRGGSGLGQRRAPSSSMPQSGSGESVAALASCFHLIELNATEAMAPRALKWTTADRAAEPDAEASSSDHDDDDDDDDDEVFEYILDDKENQKREQEDKEEGESDEDDDYRSRKRRSSNWRGAAAVSARGRHALEREGLFGIDEEIVEEDTDDGSVATSSKLPKKRKARALAPPTAETTASSCWTTTPWKCSERCSLVRTAAAAALEKARATRRRRRRGSRVAGWLRVAGWGGGSEQ